MVEHCTFPAQGEVGSWPNHRQIFVLYFRHFGADYAEFGPSKNRHNRQILPLRRRDWTERGVWTAKNSKNGWDTTVSPLIQLGKCDELFIREARVPGNESKMMGKENRELEGRICISNFEGEEEKGREGPFADSASP